MQQLRRLPYEWSSRYIAFVLIANGSYSTVPMIPMFGVIIPPGVLLVGFIFVFRDLAQREIGHWVIVAMIFAAGISYWTSDPFDGLAIFTAFLISEIIDWLVYTFTKRPLSDRVLYSSAISVPIDTIIFLKMVDQFDWVAVVILTTAKMIGALYYWKTLRNREALGPIAPDDLLL